MRVLSLFDGISCARVALERVGIVVSKYYASEVDKSAVFIAQKNYPDTVQLGDVRNITCETVGQIDLLIGGSPCQDLSIAKRNREGLDGERSGLFWEYVRILHEVKPTWFVLENVASMSKDVKQTITEALGVEPIMINAALVSAQTRKRLFWTNIPGVRIPEDRGIFLKDILLPETYTEFDKSYALTASYNGAILYDSIGKSRRTMVWKKPIAVEYRGATRRTRDGSGKTLEIRKDEKSNALTTVQTDSMVAKVGTIKVGQFNSGGQGQRVYSIDGKSVTLSAMGGGWGAKTGLYLIKDYARKLEPIECERLQGLPDNYTEGISKNERRKCLGNAFNVDVVAHILKGIPCG